MRRSTNSNLSTVAINPVIHSSPRLHEQPSQVKYLALGDLYLFLSSRKSEIILGLLGLRVYPLLVAPLSVSPASEQELVVAHLGLGLSIALIVLGTRVIGLQLHLKVIEVALTLQLHPQVLVDHCRRLGEGASDLFGRVVYLLPQPLVLLHQAEHLLLLGLHVLFVELHLLPQQRIACDQILYHRYRLNYILRSLYRFSSSLRLPLHIVTRKIFTAQNFLSFVYLG